MVRRKNSSFCKVICRGKIRSRLHARDDGESLRMLIGININVNTRHFTMHLIFDRNLVLF